MGKLAKIVNMPACNSIQAMLEDSGTNWDAEVIDAAGQMFGDGGFRAVVRPDTREALSFVGSRFKANNHREQLSALQPLVAEGIIVPASVSLWDNAAMMAFQFRVPSLEVVVHDSDKVMSLLTLIFNYTGTGSDMAFFAGFRAFCKNQMGAFSKLAGSDRVRHKGEVGIRYADIMGRRIQELTGETAERADTMRRMLSKPLQGRALVEYFGDSVGASKEEKDAAWITAPEELRGTAARIPEVVECYQSDDCGAGGSVWQAYNAVTRYTTHKAGRSDVTRLRNILDPKGTNAAINSRAWDKAVQLTA